MRAISWNMTAATAWKHSGAVWTRLKEGLWIWLAGSVAMLCLAALEAAFRQGLNLPLLIAPFGASAVLLYCAPQSPLARPRNVIGGHILSALVGVTVFQLLGESPMFAASLAVSTAIALMYITATLHPPGGATALLAIIGGEGIHNLGYWYALIPCAAGSALMVLLAVAVYRVAKPGGYPLR